MKSWPILTALVAVGLTGCATETLRAQSDHDSAQSFASYRTYTWIADEPLMAPPGQALQVSPLNRQRIVRAIEDEMRAKGFQKSMDRSKSDFAVSYTVGARDRLDVSSYPAPYAGRWGWGGPYFGSQVDLHMYTEGTLAIDIFDASTHQPVWHGWGSKRITAHDVTHAAEQIPPAVTQILKSVPPS